MSRRRRPGLSPSLFPFLAVLVCTLGTLILFLALVAKNATDDAEQNARAERVAKKEPPKQVTSTPSRLTAKAVVSRLAEEKFRVSQLVAFRDQQTGDLEERRDQLTQIEDHLARLRKKLKQLSDEVGLAVGDVEADEEIDQQMLVTLRKQIESEKAALEKLRGDAETKTPRVIIVPHKGPNGTDRRPVYLECDGEGVTILPEGSRISIDLLEGSSYSANPLDAALRVIRLHAMQQYGDSVPPYPLLIVRPDGVESYSAARRAMKDWDDQFGYELVPSHVKLAFSKPDPRLKQRVDFAIRDAAAHQDSLESLARGGRRQGYGQGKTAGGTSGGTAARSRRLPTLSAASLDRDGRANGFRSHRDKAYTSGQNRRGPTIGSSPYANRSQSGVFHNDDSGAAARDWAAKMRSATQEMRHGDRSSEQVGNGLLDPQGSQLGSVHPDTNRASSNAAVNNSAIEKSAQTNPFSIGHQRPPSEAGVDLQKSGIAGSSAALNVNPSTSKFEIGETLKGTQRRNEYDRPSSIPGSANSSSTQLNEWENHGEAHIDRGQGTSNKMAAARSSSLGNGGTPAADSESSQQRSSQQRSSQQRSSPTKEREAIDDRASNGAPSMNAEMNPRPVLRREGKDWALPDSVAGIRGNAIIRTIRVECHADRFVLLAPGSGGATEMYGFSNGDIERATMSLASALHERIERWGPALPGGRWEPRLEVVVMPQGELRFHQLRTLMRGSGIEVVGRAER